MLRKTLLSFLIGIQVFCAPLSVFASESDGILNYIYSSQLTRSEERTCQITVQGKIPEGMANAYITIMNMENGNMYQAPLVSENNYSDRFFVEAGTYKVVELQFYDDTIMQYPFLPISDFTLQDEEAIVLTVEPKDYEKIEEELNAKREMVEGPKEEPVVVEEEKEEELTVESDFDVTYFGNQNVALGVVGNAPKEADMVIEFTEGGEKSTAKFKISDDGGSTFGTERTLPLSGIVKLSGLTLTFEGDYFETGDKFTFFLPDSNKVIENNGSVFATNITLFTEDAHIYAYDIMQENGYSISIKIVKEEPVIYDVSLDGGNTWLGEQYLPEDRTFPIGNSGIYAKINEVQVLADSQATYTVPEIKEFNYVLVGAVVVGVCTILGYLFMKLRSKKTPSSAYHMRRYIGRKED